MKTEVKGNFQEKSLLLSYVRFLLAAVPQQPSGTENHTQQLALPEPGPH